MLLRHCCWCGRGLRLNRDITAMRKENKNLKSEGLLTNIIHNKRSSAIAEGPRDTWCQFNSCQPLLNCAKIPFEKALMVEWPWWSFKVIGIATVRQVIHYDFLLVVCSNNVAILHRFQDTNIFTVYAIACNLEKSFNLAMISKNSASC